MTATASKYIVPLANDAAAARAIAGGKGASLHRLIRARHNVPPGFVVSAAAFARFLKQAKLDNRIRSILAYVLPDDVQTIIEASTTIQKAIAAAPMPEVIGDELARALSKYRNKRFAVRSSAGAEDGSAQSWAGQFDTFLNVNASDVEASVKRCWASLFNVRAISYKPEAYTSSRRLRFAVVVQTMVQSDVAGVAFSTEPTTSDSRRIVVEAVRGLGEKLVSGQDRAYSAVIDKSTRRLVRRSATGIDEMLLLSSRKIQLLTAATTKLEREFGVPVDVEWAFRGNDLHILQARPITSAARPVKRRFPSLPEIADYELTFKVSGLSFLFADMLAHGFSYLDPLFTSDADGSFRQHFSNARMIYAADFGLRWYGQADAFTRYQESFRRFYERSRARLERLGAVRTLSRASVADAFHTFSGLLKRYSRMDNQFTNFAFLWRERNPIIAANLERLSQFKDVARVWINRTLIDEDCDYARLCASLTVHFGLAPGEVDGYRVADVLALFEGARVPVAHVAARRHSYVMYYEGGEQRYVVGKRAAAYIASVTADISADGEIRGQVAHRRERTVAGRVRIISVDYGNLAQVNREIDQMVSGEILVAEFTAPELLAACRKARAIVTDIGGLLSHAAIVSRDLDVPCIVGTRCATKLLRTGDDVTIDFDRGVVMKEPASATV